MGQCPQAPCGFASPVGQWMRAATLVDATSWMDDAGAPQELQGAQQHIPTLSAASGEPQCAAAGWPQHGRGS